MDGRQLLATIAVVMSAAAAFSPILGEDQSPPASVSVDDIGRKVTLVGRLGQPLGTMMTIQGHWAYPDASKGPAKDNSIRFTVSHVNGKPLSELVEFDVAQVRAVSAEGDSAIPEQADHRDSLGGVSWTLRGFETGRFDRIPDGYWKELGTGWPALPYYVRTFTSELVGVVQRHPPISKEKVISIANGHFGRATDSGCYVEERGDYFFVAPPYKLKADLKRAGVYIDKATGELFESKLEK